MADVKIGGVICPNDYAWYYDWTGQDYTCPEMVENAIENAKFKNEKLTVEISSPGGEIAAGSEIYALLKAFDNEGGNVEIKITGQACSAASVIAMAAHSIMSPTALMMIHCVSSYINGNHNDMEKMAEVLKEADEAMCTAYMAKTGMTKEAALELMENETWLTAAHAKELGLVDEIMFENEENAPIAAALFSLPTEEQMNEAKEQMAAFEKGIALEECRIRAEKLIKKQVDDNE